MFTAAQARKQDLRHQTSQRLLQSGNGSVEVLGSESSLEEAAGEDGDFAALAGRVVAQQEQIERLTADLDAANAKRAELAKANSELTQQLADHDRLLRALRDEASEMAVKLTAAQETLASKDRLIDQLKSVCSGTDLAVIGLAADGTGWSAFSGSSTPNYGGRHSGNGSPGNGNGSPGKRSLSRQSSKGLIATQHGVGKVVSAWKESGKLKDLKIEELNFQLGQAAAQVELARQEAAELQQQLVDSRAEVSAGAAALATAQARSAAQLQALESQLASKDAGLAAGDVRLVALEAELRSANSKASSLQKQLELGEAEVVRLGEAAAAAAARLSACQAELAAAKEEMAGGHRVLHAAKHEAQQACNAAAAERQALSQLEGQVAKLAGVLRQLLVSVSSNGSSAAILEPPKAGTPPITALSEMVDLVAAKLMHKLHDLAAAAARMSELDARLTGRGEELAQLQGTLKAQSDKIFAQQSALGKAQEEVRALRGQLESRAAQQGVIEAEIGRQVEEYGRLKRQLLVQEELQAALAAKTEQLSASSQRCGELEVQLARSVEQATANSQRLAALKVAADGAARAQAEAAVQRQEALASLEVARSELDKVQLQLQLAQSAADKKGQEVRELNHMLKAWEAMRLGKDAQIAALMERCKRNEEDAAEKARTVDALRRKLALAGRPCSAGSASMGSVSGGLSSVATAGMMLQQQAGLLGAGAAGHNMLNIGMGGSSSGGVYGGSNVQGLTVGGAAGSPRVLAAAGAAGGVAALRRSWAAESGSPSGSPTRSVGSSYGYS